MNVKAIIFDLDGTILDTEGIWAEATKQMLEDRGIIYANVLQKKIHNAVHGLPPIKACALLKLIVQLHESPEELAHEKEQRAYQLIKGNVKFIPGFEHFFQTIAPTLPTAVATNCPTRFIKLVSQEMDLNRLFDDRIYDPSYVQHKAKPEPALYLYAAEQLQVNPANCLAIEDSTAGIISAINAGMLCAGINTDGNRNNLKKAHYIVQNYTELELLID